MRSHLADGADGLATTDSPALTGSWKNTMPEATVVIVSWNGAHLLEPCLKAVTEQAYPAGSYEVIVVDNGSTDGSVELVRSRFSAVHVIDVGRNLGYAGAANLGWLAAKGTILALLNQDAIPRPDWLTALTQALVDLSIGVVGSKILEPDGTTLQHAGGHIDWPLVEGQHFGGGERDDGQFDEPREVEYVSGAALALRRDVIERVGMMDEGFYPGYFEDVDLCFRIRKAGYGVHYAPQATVIHNESSSFNRLATGKGPVVYRSRLRFILKHYPPIQIASEFVPAEIERLPLMFEEQLRSLILACTEAQIMWPSLAARLPRTVSRDELKVVLGALQRLHRAAAAQQAGLSTRFREESASRDGDLEMSTSQEAQRRRLVRLAAEGWRVEEKPFRSEVPILGRLIAAFRTAWIRVAAKWYVQSLFSQQETFNYSVAQLLRQHVTQLRDREASIAALAEQSARLELKMMEIQEHLAELESTPVQAEESPPNDLAGHASEDRSAPPATVDKDG